MTTLHEIVQEKYTDKHTVHSYIETYEQHFAPRKGSAMNVLEIGMCYGGSILMWYEYFENATITTIDVETRNLLTDLNKDRIRVFLGNAYDQNAIDVLVDRKYDIIIDDGPHTLESMIYTASVYSTLLTDNGVLVIEDIQSMSWIDPITQAFPAHLQDKVKVVDLRSVKDRYDDVLIIMDLSI